MRSAASWIMDRSGAAADVSEVVCFIATEAAPRSLRARITRPAVFVQERPGVRPLVVARELPGAPQNVFVAGQAVKPHGAARVQSAGADSDLGAESIPVSIGKARGGVVVDAGGVDLVQEAASGFRILGDDGVGVGRAVAPDVLDGLGQSGNHLHGENQIAVLAVPLTFRDGLDKKIRKGGAGQRTT